MLREAPNHVIVTPSHLGGLLVALSLLATASDAHAQAELDEARQAYEEADFEAALAAYERAADSDDLERAALERLLEGRALVRLALGDEEGMDRDLSWLAAVNAEHELSDEAPPEIRVAFEAAARQWDDCCELDLDLDHGDGRAPRLSATLGEAPEGLVQRFELRYRLAGGSESTEEYTEVDDTQVYLDLESGTTTVEAYAVARGPGGVEIARVGAVDRPERFELTVANDEENDVAQRQRRRRALGLGLGLGLGAAAVAAAVVVVLLFTLPQEGPTQPSAPGLLEF
jgi:hypothetical protein